MDDYNTTGTAVVRFFGRNKFFLEESLMGVEENIIRNRSVHIDTLKIVLVKALHAVASAF